ncbi:MAG: hypothetical protein ABWZ64_03905 [Xanthobacteraceae bacterium]
MQTDKADCVPGKKKGEKKRKVCAKSLVFFTVAPNGLGSNDAPPFYDYFAALRARLGRLQKREFCPKGEVDRDPDSSADSGRDRSPDCDAFADAAAYRSDLAGHRIRLSSV